MDTIYRIRKCEAPKSKSQTNGGTFRANEQLIRELYFSLPSQMNCFHGEM